MAFERQLVFQVTRRHVNHYDLSGFVSVFWQVFQIRPGGSAFGLYLLYGVGHIYVFQAYQFVSERRIQKIYTYGYSLFDGFDYWRVVE
jgi:hypothetical protein